MNLLHDFGRGRVGKHEQKKWNKIEQMGIFDSLFVLLILSTVQKCALQDLIF